MGKSRLPARRSKSEGAGTARFVFAVTCLFQTDSFWHPHSLRLCPYIACRWSGADASVLCCAALLMVRGLRAAVDELGLEVHGVIVGNTVTKVMEDLCTHLHVFKSWTAVGGR